MKSKNCILIIGLPASGKTTLAQKIAKEKEYFLIDDPMDLNSYEKHMKDNIVICDPLFCREKTLKRAEILLKTYNYVIEKIYFENDPQQCIANAKLRNGKRVDGSINFLTESYEPINPIPVYKKK